MLLSLRFPRRLQCLLATLATSCVAVSLTACGGSSRANPGSAGPVPPATTTLRAQTANDTSAANSFGGRIDGNAPAENVSKLPVQDLLYTGANTKIYATWMGWFGSAAHMDVGYKSNEPAEVHRQVEDMISRGIQGAIAAWYGPGSFVDSSTQLLRDEAEAHAGQFQFAIMEDSGALGAAAKAHGCDVTDQLISDLTYVASQYESSPAYMKMNGRPVVFFFSVNTYYIDWNRVVSSIPGNPLLIFRGNVGFTQNPSNGAYSWADVAINNPFDPELAAQDAFYTAAQQASGRIAFGAAYKGFNDTLAPWGTNRIIDQNCGQTWLQSFAEAGKYYNSSNQLPGLEIVTWNDYEEGTAIEPGIDNCVYLAPSQSGTTIQWAVNGGNENTVDHYTVYLSTDGVNLSKLTDVPAGTHSIDLAQWTLSSSTYLIYVQAVGKPSIQNKMSTPITYHAGDQPPAAQLQLSQTGPLTYTASVSGSSGSIARSVIDFGDGTVVKGTSASHTYGAVGSYLVTATIYDSAGASSVAVQQISAKPQAGGVTIATPGNGSTVNWPTMLVASANAGSPVAAMEVLIDGQEAYAAHGDTLRTALKVFTGSHQLTVQSLDSSGNPTGSASLNVVAEPGDVPPVARITITPLTSVSPTAVLACTADSYDPDGFLLSYDTHFSNGSNFTTQAAVVNFSSVGAYSATTTVMDKFGATATTTTKFSVGGATAPGPAAHSVNTQSTPQPHKPLEPARPPE